MFSKNWLVTRKTKWKKETKTKTKNKKTTNKQTNKQKELTTTNEKLHENCRIVQKTDSTIDWQNKDEEAQSNSNCALCDTQRNSWQGIVKLPHNQESDC